VAEWLRSGLQIRLYRFDSGRRLQALKMGEQMKLSGKTAVITGAASGFGKGIAEKFSQEGAKIILADLNNELVEQTATNINQDWQHLDVANSDSMKSLSEYVIKKYGSIDIMINNAGITHLPMPLEDLSEEEFDKVFAVNAKSVFFCGKYFVPHMKKSKRGSILNIASTAGLSPRPNLNWYNASKGWMITATKTMAVELATHNIRVNALAPVAGETPLLKSFLGEDTPERRNAFLSTIPLGRFSTPEDLANTACFICSDEASMITGAVLEVDGGRCI
jgi:3-oxoacyl-[acyl-carrier protein] reductase